MADEYNKPQYNCTMPFPKAYSWQTHTNKSGIELEVHYNNLFSELAKKKGIWKQLYGISEMLGGVR